MNNILITGTDKKLTLDLGALCKSQDIPCLHYAVIDEKNHTPHTIALSPYAASMIKAYGESKLQTIHVVVLCLQKTIPKPINKATQKDMDNLFRTQWFFVLDMIRHSLEFLQKSSHKNNKSLLLISKPALIEDKEHSLDTLFFATLDSAIKTYTHNFLDVSIKTMIQNAHSTEYTQSVYKKILDHTESKNNSMDIRGLSRLQSSTHTMTKKVKNLFKG